MKKLFVCLLFTAFLPIAASPVQTSSTNSTPFITIALAGRSSLGGWCECGSPGDCLCDPGEVPNGQTVSRNTQDRNETPTSPTQDEGIDFGTAALMLVFFALTLSRLRG
jgi:hypothetical protein